MIDWEYDDAPAYCAECDKETSHRGWDTHGGTQNVCNVCNNGWSSEEGKIYPKVTYITWEEFTKVT